MTREHAYTRRDFLRSTAAAAAVTTASPILAAPDAREASVVVLRDAKAMIDATRVDPTVVKKMVTDTLLRVTGQSSVKSAWLSLLKPTDVVGLVYTRHLNPTHTEVIQAVKDSLLEAGLPAANIRDVEGQVDITPMTALISLPGLKAHWLTGIGTVLKNYIMFSGNPSSYHNAANENLGEIWRRAAVQGKTKLILVDALRPLCDKGPQPDPRYMWPYKGLIAGKDPVAVEAVCLQIIMEKRRLLRGEPWPLSPPPLCVKAADEKFHLGVSNLQQIKIDQVGWRDESLL
jgi:hypothetical protein